MLPLVSVHDPSLPKPPKSDIQDKTNKTCSSCTITFDSRRSFIEHCTTVHNMRFKTKAGVTISGNTVQRRLQEEAMKRKMAEEERQNQQTSLKRKAELEAENGSSAAKKLGLMASVAASVTAVASNSSAESLDDGTIIEGSGKKTLYTPSGVSKWNQCKYECCFCKRTTMSRSSMRSHIQNIHKLSPEEYKKSKYPDIGMLRFIHLFLKQL